MSDVSSSLPATEGDIISRLSEVIYIAQWKWSSKITQRSIADITKLHPRSLFLLQTNQAQSYSYPTLAKLCWFFGSQPGDILVYWPADTPLTREALVARSVSRTSHPPAPPDHDYGHIVNHIPERLQGEQPKQVSMATGITVEDIVALSRPGTQRIYRRTLAALCAYWQVDVRDLLSYQGEYSEQR